ncbi:hypothetical protein ACHAXA_008111 [Cyclostephanos tholiformis]|uniref:Uncharacterized protein n=1 Tax=Cyclostephanos tholiformis TaxID=382380 RepID=A0ABD3SEZ2_9STRA
MPSSIELVALIIISLLMIDMSTCFVTDQDVVRPADADAADVVVVAEPDDDGTTTTCAPDPTMPPPAPFSVRLHLIRHGETQANVRGLVLGQGDSPLTERGLADARSASMSDTINGRAGYWRTYCSDLGRAKKTARIVLGIIGDDDDDNDEDDGGDDVDDYDGVVRLIPDARLREVAKGAREGYSKKYTIEEAMEMRRGEALLESSSSIYHRGGKGQSSLSNYDVDIPKLESADDAWGRAKDWIHETIDHAFEDYHRSKIVRMERGGRDDIVDTRGGDDSDNDEDDDDPKVYDVFALTHSALIRTIIHRMVESQLPSDYARTREGSLEVPNLSRTIIDVRPFYCDDNSHRASARNDNDDASSMSSRRTTPRWTTSLRRLADVSHLQRESRPMKPPYL